MPSPVVEACRAIARACERLGLRWYVFGAQAAILRGARRFTADLDVTLDPAGRQTREIVEALTREGWTLRVEDPDAFVRATRVLPMRAGESGLPVDVVLAGPGVEDRFFEGVSEIEVDGTRIPVPRVEDLIVMKLLAGRPKDAEDVVALLAANPHADEGAIRAFLGELEALLDQHDLAPALDRALARARRARPER